MPYKGKLAFNRYCTQIHFTVIEVTIKKNEKEKEDPVREKEKQLHPQGATPNNLGDALWHPYY